MAIYTRSATGEFLPHGLSVLVIEGAQIIGIEVFVDSALPARFEGAAL